MLLLSLSPPNATQLIRAVCPWAVPPNRRSVCADATSHRKTERSPPEEANRAFEEETLSERTSYPCAE